MGRLRERPDSEHEQVVVRLAIAIAALAYLNLTSFGDGTLADAAAGLRGLGAAYAFASALLLAHLLHAPAVNPPRRLVGLALDMTTLTLALVAGGSAGAVFYPFYLWIIAGMGFRYGRRYLLVSAALGLASFALVIAVSPYWQQHPALAAGLWAALIALPLYAGKLLVTLTDAIERAEAASLAKSRFLATISHELRTPLHAVLASTDLLGSTRLDQEQRALVRTAQSSGRALLALIDEVLGVAAVGEDQAEQAVPFDLHQLLVAASDLVRLQAAAKGLAFRLRIDPAAPYAVRGARRALQQILQNLLANAVKFTSAGNVSLMVQVVGQEGARVHLRIEVRDTGIGIPKEAQGRIFERFSQADESTTRRFGGTGLGLAIARQLAEAIEARLTVDSTPGVGSTFGLELALEVGEGSGEPQEGGILLLAPAEAFLAWKSRIEALGFSCPESRGDMAIPDAARAILSVGDERPPPAQVPLVVVAERQEEIDEAIAVLSPACSDRLLGNALHAALARPPQTQGGGVVEETPSRRILVAEDNRINRQVIERILARGGHQTTLVANGEEALDALDRARFDMVLMDLNMPVMDGIEAIKLHRVACPKEEAPIFAALTADVTEATRKACAEADVEVVVTKPVEPRQLLSLIAQLTAGQPASRRTAAVRPAAHGAPPVEGEGPVFEPVHLLRLRELDPDGSFLPMVLRDFLDDAHSLAGELESAVRAGDAAGFRDRAHALRSSAAYVGAKALFDLCGTWRGIGPDELARRGAHHMARLRVELHRLEMALPETLPQLSNLISPADEGDA